jgi:hypothetical protein
MNFIHVNLPTGAFFSRFWGSLPSLPSTFKIFRLWKKSSTIKWLLFAQRFITIFNCRYPTSNNLSVCHKSTSLSPINCQSVDNCCIIINTLIVNFQNLPPVKKIKYNKILTYILRSIFLEIPHLEFLRWGKMLRDTNGNE